MAWIKSSLELTWLTAKFQLKPFGKARTRVVIKFRIAIQRNIVYIRIYPFKKIILILKYPNIFNEYVYLYHTLYKISPQPLFFNSKRILLIIIKTKIKFTNYNFKTNLFC